MIQETEWVVESVRYNPPYPYHDITLPAAWPAGDYEWNETDQIFFFAVRPGTHRRIYRKLPQNPKFTPPAQPPVQTHHRR